MIDLGKWAFGHSKLVYFLLAVLLVGGLKSAYDMGKLEDPEVKVKIAMGVGGRPGASAHEMELEVTDPLEKAIRTVGEVDNTQSWSYNDLCIIQVELKSTTPDDRLEQCWDMLRHKVSDAEASLPGGTSVTVQDDFSLVYGMFYALTAEGFSERQLAGPGGALRKARGEYRYFAACGPNGDTRHFANRSTRHPERTKRHFLCRLLRQRGSTRARNGHR